MSTFGLIALAVFAVALLLVLVLALRLHAFLALLITSLTVAILGGIPLEEVAGEIQRAMGSSLGYIAVVIGLGAMFGEMLRRSGAASGIAHTLLAKLGEDKAPLALAATGLLVAIPVFFDVAFILFVPLLYSLSQRSQRPLLGFALPLLAGLAVAHAFVPPTPGPVAVAGLLGAELGWVIVFGLAAGVPALAVGGLWFGRFVAPRIDSAIAEAPVTEAPDDESPDETPGFALSACLIGLPIALILAATVSRVVLEDGCQGRAILQFFGHPFAALLLATLAAFYFLGLRRGVSRLELREMASKSLEPVGLILLVTGAGGVLGKVLLATGVGEAVAQGLAASRMPLVVLAFLLAAVVRVAQGSATVAMVTGAGLVAPVVESGGYSAPMLGAVTVAIAAGATVLSHVNDSGFWLVSRYLGLSERATLRSWTVMTTLVGTTGFTVVLGLSLLL